MKFNDDGSVTIMGRTFRGAAESFMFIEGIVNEQFERISPICDKKTGEPFAWFVSDSKPCGENKFRHNRSDKWLAFCEELGIKPSVKHAELYAASKQS